MRFVAAADSHFKNSEPLGHLNPKTGLNLRTEEKLRHLDKAISYAVEQKVDFFIYLGDLFDSAHPQSKLRVLVAQVFSKYVSKIPIIYVPGNHDDCQVGAFESEGILARSGADRIKDLSCGFHYIGEPTHIVLNGISTLFLPWKHTSKLPDYLTKNIRLVFGHFFVEGADIGKGSCRQLDNVGYSTDGLSDFAYFVLGDIHKGQVIPLPKSKGAEGFVVYPGSLSRINIDDGDIEPGFLDIVCPEEGDLSATRVTVDDWEISRLSLDEGTIPDPTDIQAHLESHLSGLSPKIVELTFVGHTTWLDQIAYTALKKYLIDLGAVKVIRKRKSVDTDEVTAKVYRGSLEDRWVGFATDKGLPIDSINLVSNYLR